MKSSIKKLLDGTITPEQILRDHVVLITTKDGKQSNKDTVISKELIDLIIIDIKDGDSSRRPAYYDEEENVVKNGIKFRSLDGTD